MINPTISNNGDQNFSGPPLSHTSTLKWLVIGGFWTLFGFLYANQMYLVVHLNPRGRPVSWWRLIAWQVPSWWIWVLLTPFIIWLGKKFPLQRASLIPNLLFHLLTSVILAAIQLVFYAYLANLLDPFYTPVQFRSEFARSYVVSLTEWFHVNFLVYWAIVGVGYAFDYYDRFREREHRASQLEGELAQAQLQTLRMQLHPHFLFNTLNAIVGLMRNNENKAAISMTVGLGELLRHTLENAGKQEVPLSEELDFLERYLDIQRNRFSDRLTVQMNIEPETLNARVPNLILQPLVENAIKHGIGQNDSAGLIVINTARDNGILKVTVQDDGPGLPKGWRIEDSSGIGIANTRRRLQQLYDSRHSFVIHDRSEGGVEAMFTIPFRNDSVPDANDRKS